MSDIDHARGLCEFVDGCPSMFHTTARIAERLAGAGFLELSEGDAWEVVPGGRYFTRRNNSSVIAFAVGKTSTTTTSRWRPPTATRHASR